MEAKYFSGPIVLLNNRNKHRKGFANRKMRPHTEEESLEDGRKQWQNSGGKPLS